MSSISSPTSTRSSRWSISSSALSSRAGQTTKKVLEALTGLEFRVKDRKEQLEELKGRCTRLGTTLEAGEQYWNNNSNLRSTGLAAQKTLESVLAGCKTWQEHSYSMQLASDVDIKEDIDRWTRSISLSLQEYTTIMVHEIAKDALSVRIAFEGSARQNVISLGLSEPNPVPPEESQVFLEKAFKELNSADVELSTEQRAAVFKDLRIMLQTFVIPEAVCLSGCLTPDYTTRTVTSSSDVFRGLWEVDVNGERLTKVVAIKRLRNPAPSEERLKRFLYEGALWRVLSHENVVPFYGIHIQPGNTIELVSLWVENGDALLFIHRYPKCNRRAIIKGACHGLAYLHRCDVVHGSICGANILIDKDGRPMLSDLGLAAASSGDGEIIAACMSNSQTITGARWLAPEVMLSPYPVPVLASDVFSFARTILEIMTGEKPFHRNKNVYTIIAALVRNTLKVERPTDPEVVQRGLTDGVWELMNEMWSYEPERRPTMGEVEKRLERLM